MKPVWVLSSIGLLVASFSACSTEKEDSLPEPEGTGGSEPDAADPGVIFSSGGASVEAGTDSGAAGGGPTTMEPAACEAFEGLDPEADDECGMDTAAASIRKANMLLVIDKSGSMTAKPGEFTTGLWDATTTALNAALDEVKGIVSFGLVLFPDRDVELECTTDECCRSAEGNHADVPVGDGTITVPQILDTLKDTVPGGGTPTAGGLRRALEYYTTGEGANLEGDKFVMLVTDGGPNCNGALTCDEATCTVNIENRCSGQTNCCSALPAACLDESAVVEQINELRDAGIQTFVVGIPGTEAYASYLDEFAVAGGRPNPEGPSQYYAVSAEGGVQGLTDVFSSITTQLVSSCDVQLDDSPPDVRKVNVAVDCQVVRRARYADGGSEPVSGDWDLDLSTRPPTVRLLGTLCNYVTEKGVERVDIIFGCPPIF